MQMSPNDARTIAQSGMAALKGGDPGSARASFERVVAGGVADASVQLGLAYACLALQDQGAALLAVDAALRLEPGNVQALLFKADRMDQAGDARAASMFYRAAIGAAANPAQLPRELQQELARAQAMCERYAQQFDAHLREQMARACADLGAESARFTQSLDLLSGSKQIYYQQPKVYYFPGLAQTQFFEPGQFAWLERLEAATDDIREELLAILDEGAPFEPYVQSQSNRPSKRQDGLVNNPAWSAFHLWRNGEAVQENAERCPKTMAALAEVPLTRLKGRSPSIMFSLLRPGTHIPPHHGLINTRLICHLPLIVPPGCALRVGSETRECEVGKAWVFDDTIEHEAWNRSDQTRVILLFEIWRPELTLAEREMVSAMFDVIDQYQGGKVEWSI